MTMTNIQKQAYNRKEAAVYLGMAENTFVKLLKSGEVKFIRVGRRVLIPIKALDEWLDGAEGQCYDNDI